MKEIGTMFVKSLMRKPSKEEVGVIPSFVVLVLIFLFCSKLLPKSLDKMPKTE